MALPDQVLNATEGLFSTNIPNEFKNQYLTELHNGWRHQGTERLLPGVVRIWLFWRYLKALTRYSEVLNSHFPTEADYLGTLFWHFNGSRVLWKLWAGVICPGTLRYCLHSCTVIGLSLPFGSTCYRAGLQPHS